MRHPACDRSPEECRIAKGVTGGTMLGIHTTLDGNGRQLTHDPNWYATPFSCETCGRRWMARVHMGQTTVEDAT